MIEVLVLAHERGGQIVRDILDDLVAAATRDLKLLEEVETGEGHVLAWSHVGGRRMTAEGTGWTPWFRITSETPYGVRIAEVPVQGVLSHPSVIALGA